MKIPIFRPHPKGNLALLRAALPLLLCLAPSVPCAAADDPNDGWKTLGDKVGSTTPFPLGTHEARAEGFWHGVWDGTKRIWSEGSQDLYVSGYYYHTPYGFSKSRRDEFNDNAWGAGYGRTLTEDNENQRMFYGMVVHDSHRKPLYLAGYAWLARWDMGRDLRVGAGYSALLIAHSTSTNYWPVPLLAPIVSFGTNDAALYGTYFNAIGYFFFKLSFDR
jgi:palmitoyl transferase